MQLAGFLFPQYFDNNGNPLNGGKIYAYAADTVTPQDTYSNAAGTALNTNPIVLSSSGRTKIFLQALPYDFVIKNSLGVTIDTISGVGSSGQGGLSSVANLGALRALASGAFDYVEVGGYSDIGDGGGGLFYWNAASTATQDFGVVITPNSAPVVGRWVRMYSGPVNVKWFGAKGDGSTDDISFINTAKAYVQGLTNGGTLFFPQSTGGYFFSSNPSFGTKTAVQLDDAAFFTSAAVALTFGCRFIKSRSKAFSATVGLVTFSNGANVSEVYPEWWGGKADNATDNLAAFVAAIATLTASGMGVLSLGRGIYKYGTAAATTSLIYNGPVTGPATNGLIIRGQGRLNTTLSYLGTGDGITLGSNINGITLEDFRFSSSTGNRSIVFISNPSVSPSPDIGTSTLSKMDIRGWLGDAISVGLCVILTTKELEVVLNGGNGIVFELTSPKATTWHDTNSWFHENGGIGIVLNGPTILTLDGTTSDSNTGISTAAGVIKYAGYTMVGGGTYKSCGPGNLGMTVLQAGAVIGTLSHFDNTSQEWVINATAVPATVGALVTKSGSGAGQVIRVTGLTAVVGDLAKSVSQGGAPCGTLTSFVTIDATTQDWTMNITAGQEILGGSSLTIPTGTAGTGTAGGSSTTTVSRQKNSIGLYAKNVVGLNLSGGDFENHLYGIYLENVYDSAIAPGKLLTQGTNAWGLYVAGSCSRIAMGGFSVDVQAGGAGDIYFGSECIGLTLIGGHATYTFTNRSRDAMVITALNASPITLDFRSTGQVPWVFTGYNSTGALLQVGSGATAGYAGSRFSVNGFTKDFYLDQATGDLFFVSSGLAKYVRLLGSATDRANQRLFWSTSAGTKAVSIGATEGVRAGSNVESDFSVDMYDDAGALLFTGIKINRAAYWVSINAGLSTNTVKLGGVWQTSVATVGSVNAVETDLWSFNIPANMLSRNGDSLEVFCGGTYAANGNGKRLKFIFGSATVYNSGSIAFNNAQWGIHATLVRTAGSVQVTNVRFGSNSALNFSETSQLDAAENTAGAIVIRVTGTGVATNDIVCKYAKLRWDPAA
jgi:hypothetical protein